MTVFPTEKTLKKWISLVPTDGDLVFFKDLKQAEEFVSLDVPLFTRFEAWDQGADLLGLNQRSWYGYSMGKAAACTKFPSGLIESLDAKTQLKIFRYQQKIKVPTILEITPELEKLDFLKFADRLWITTHKWNKAPTSTKLKILNAYYQQNPRIEKYKSLQPHSQEAQKILKQYQLQKLLGTFAERSGPNCLALVARAISKQNDQVAATWLHWPPLRRFLELQGFAEMRDTKPQSGDVLVFMRDGTGVHACITLDSRHIIEKPGQDFYEPYIVNTLKKSRTSWKNATLHIWRKK
ncbi:hypothetical protein [Bdellovibrio sp. HCB337]|uniref:hypothetical protein n=1 Tax=Bdellovibrio sp. HCB337 TaxID=3394358 RepID=UPI0039A68ACB